MGKRKKINPRMVVLVFLIGMAISFFLSLFAQYKKANEREEDKIIMAAFDKFIEELTGSGFQHKELILAEEIKDYEMYINPRYIVLNKTNRALRGIEDYINMSTKEKITEIANQEKMIKDLLADTCNISELAAQKEKLTWMMIFKSDADDSSFQLLDHRLSDIRDSLEFFENKSYGWRYIIDAMYDDSTICRFIMVAPKDNPSKIEMGGGRIMTIEEKKEEDEEEKGKNNRLHFFLR